VPSSFGVHVLVPMLHALTAPESIKHAQNVHPAGNALQLVADDGFVPVCVTVSQN
jgi:hypothetical protein